MGLIENAKEVADLVKKIGDIELYRKIVALEGEIIDLTRKGRFLETENDELKSALKKKKDLSFSAQFFVDAEQKRNCCPHCWQDDQKIIYVIGPQHYEDGRSSYTCPTCGRFYNCEHGIWNVSGGRVT